MKIKKLFNVSLLAIINQFLQFCLANKEQETTKNERLDILFKKISFFINKRKTPQGDRTKRQVIIFMIM